MAKRFSRRTFRHTGASLNEKIYVSPEGTREMKQIIAKTFQKANRRIQNIERTGEFSPAVAALNKGNIKRYSKFSVGGHSWNELKREYAKAVGFLKQPTSTATGTREYTQSLEREYNITHDEYIAMTNEIRGKLNSLEDSNFVERYLMRYKDFTGDLKREARSIADNIEQSAAEAKRRLLSKIADETITGEQLEMYKRKLRELERRFK